MRACHLHTGLRGPVSNLLSKHGGPCPGSCMHAWRWPAGQLGLGDLVDHWDATQVQRLQTSAQRFYDLRMSYIKPWRVLQVACGRHHTAAIVETELDMRDLA